MSLTLRPSFKMITVFHAGEEKLAGYADEVKDGRIVCERVE